MKKDIDRYFISKIGKELLEVIYAYDSTKYDNFKPVLEKLKKPSCCNCYESYNPNYPLYHCRGCNMYCCSRYDTRCFIVKDMNRNQICYKDNKGVYYHTMIRVASKNILNEHTSYIYMPDEFGNYRYIRL
jgi:hypothetical protein